MENKTSISLAELRQLLKDKKDIMLIDVRSQLEYKQQHIPTAQNIPSDRIESADFMTYPAKAIITVCQKGGGRSKKAANFIRNFRNTGVYFLEGGTTGWFEDQKTKFQ